jgi:hypothetical protein
MKKPWIAFLLNFLVAGAGFAYLGKLAWAGINFVAAIAIGLIVYHFSADSLNTASVIVAAASASFAMTTAKTMNAKLTPQPVAAPRS